MSMKTTGLMTWQINLLVEPDKYEDDKEQRQDKSDRDDWRTIQKAFHLKFLKCSAKLYL